MDKVDKIIKILNNNMGELSDGYGYYCNNPDEKLREIAEEILKDIGE
jgi:predicted DNA-binding transcriptional regulator